MVGRWAQVATLADELASRSSEMDENVARDGLKSKVNADTSHIRQRTRDIELPRTLLS